MITAFYTAAVGTTQVQKGFDVVSNNIANVNTAGFKAEKNSFADLIYTNIRASEEDTNLKVGHGVKLKKTDVLHNQSGFMPTGRDMDFAIEGNGFFAVQTADGTIKYTRCGNFEKSIIGGRTYLTAMQGGYVLDTAGRPIEITGEEDQELNIGAYTFPNRDGLTIEAGLFFTANETSGAAAADPDSTIKQGYLENSNVDMGDAMVDVIEMQRAFQFNARMVQIADEVMQTVNNLR